MSSTLRLLLIETASFASSAPPPPQFQRKFESFIFPMSCCYFSEAARTTCVKTSNGGLALKAFVCIQTTTNCIFSYRHISSPLLTGSVFILLRERCL